MRYCALAVFDIRMQFLYYYLRIVNKFSIQIVTGRKVFELQSENEK